MKYKFDEILELSDNYKGVVQIFTECINTSILNSFNDTLSYIEFDEHDCNPSYLKVQFVQGKLKNNLQCSILLDINYESIYIGFEDYGDNNLMERCGNDIALYKKAFEIFLKIKWKKVYLGNNNMVKEVSYFALNPDGVFFDSLPFGFYLKPSRFWQSKNVALYEEFFDSIL